MAIELSAQCCSSMSSVALGGGKAGKEGRDNGFEEWAIEIDVQNTQRFLTPDAGRTDDGWIDGGN